MPTSEGWSQLCSVPHPAVFIEVLHICGIQCIMPRLKRRWHAVAQGLQICPTTPTTGAEVCMLQRTQPSRAVHPVRVAVTPERSQPAASHSPFIVWFICCTLYLGSMLSSAAQGSFKGQVNTAANYHQESKVHVFSSTSWRKTATLSHKTTT